MTPTTGQWGAETTSASGHSYSFTRNTGYERANVFYSGIPSPSTLVNAPQQFKWISQPTSYNAGIAC